MIDLPPICNNKTPSSANSDNSNNIISIHDINQDVFIDQVTIPPIVPASTVVNNTSCTFTDAMRSALVHSINLHHLQIRPTNFTGANITSTRHNSRMRTHLKYRFNMMLVPVIGDGNCLFRSLSHIIFGNESEYNNVRISLINTLNKAHMFLDFVPSRGIMN